MSKFIPHYTPKSKEDQAAEVSRLKEQLKSTKEKQSKLDGIRKSNAESYNDSNKINTNVVSDKLLSTKKTRLEMMSDDDESGMLVEVSY